MPPRTLIKLGGSLLALPQLRELIQHVMAQRPSVQLVVTVGGGEVVDQIREWDRIHRLGEEQSHWLALEAIGLNERLLLLLFPEWKLVRSLQQLEAAEREGRIPLICSHCFFKWGERHIGLQQEVGRLPHTWETCSDSLAWWFAELISAQELLLLKSVDWPQGKNWNEAASAELVDPQFPRLVSGEIQIRWVNGRQDQPTIVNCSG